MIIRNIFTDIRKNLRETSQPKLNIVLEVLINEIFFNTSSTN